MNGAAEKLVRSWVRLYTLGLDLGDRDGRRAEIESDLWEHQHEVQANGEGAATLSILGRWAAGLPADLSWRLSQRPSKRTTKEPMMPTALFRSWWQVLAALTAAATVYAGIDQFFSDDVSAEVDVGKVFALVLFVGSGVVTVIGLAIHRTEPRRGARLVMIGVLPLALVGGLGIGILVGLVASLAGGQGWWWVPVGVAGLVATAAGLGAFGAWWHAAPVGRTPNRRVAVLPIALVLGGLLVASVGVGLGLVPLLGVGAVPVLFGAIIWARRAKTAF